MTDVMDGISVYDPLLDRAVLDARIQALCFGYTGYAAETRQREQAYWRNYAPPFRTKIGEYDYGEHDQWPGDVKPEDVDHTRSSFNMSRPVAEAWTSLEAGLEFPNLRWAEELLLPPVPGLDPAATSKAEETYVANKMVARHVATLREQVLGKYVRTAKLNLHYFKAILHKNRSGQAWIRILPDQERRIFQVKSEIDNSTVFPVWTDAQEDIPGLDAVLVVSRRSAVRVKEQWPEADIQLETNGLTVERSSYYAPTDETTNDAKRRYVWIEDYWLADRQYSTLIADGPPISGRVINAIRVNGEIVQVTEYPGWKQVPYFHVENDNGRDRTGFSDVGTMMPIQDALNRMMSEQSDVIHGSSRPKWLYKSDGAGSTPQIADEGVSQIATDEDLAQLRAAVDVFPTQVHGQQLWDLTGRVTGLPPVVWGEIPRMNSGRALASAWKAVSGRMQPRVVDDTLFLNWFLGFMLDCMELYRWDDADLLYGGNRDFSIDFPNQDSRDPSEISLNAINLLHANLVDWGKAMEMIGDRSPDETQEKVRRDLSDPILHADEQQKQLMIARLRQSLQLEAQNAQIQAMQAAQAGGQAGPQAPLNAQQGQVQAQVAQAQAQGQPTLAPQQNAPAAQPGAPNQAQAPANISAMLQNGQIGNRMIVQGKG